MLIPPQWGRAVYPACTCSPAFTPLVFLTIVAVFGVESYRLWSAFLWCPLWTVLENCLLIASLFLFFVQTWFPVLVFYIPGSCLLFRIFSNHDHANCRQGFCLSTVSYVLICILSQGRGLHDFDGSFKNFFFIEFSLLGFFFAYRVY